MGVKETLASIGKDIVQDLAATAPALAREAVNDVRSTVHQAFWGQPEAAPGVGTPMNPTQREIYEEKLAEPEQEQTPQQTPQPQPEPQPEQQPEQEVKREIDLEPDM